MKLLTYLPLLCMLNATVSLAQDAPVVKDSAVVAPVVAKIAPVKYVKEIGTYLPPVASALRLVPYYDYAEAQVAAKALKKPLMLYFTGIINNNARTMERRVWANPKVAKMLREDFVIAFLYCDEKQYELPLRQQYYSKYIHKQVIHVGEKNLDLQASKYGTIGQPMLYFVNDDLSKLVVEPFTYNVEPQKFIEYLNRVKEAYASTH